MSDAEARRLARANWTTKVFKNNLNAEAEADARFWGSMSPQERVLLAWSLSQEMFAIAQSQTTPTEPRLSRSVVRIVRS